MKVFLLKKMFCTCRSFLSPLLTCLCGPSQCQTQAEAHYKGHKHARKLKALESQRSRQKGGRGPHRGTNKERSSRVAPGAEPPAADSHLKDPTGTSQAFVSAFLPVPLPLLLLWVINGNLTDMSTEPRSPHPLGNQQLFLLLRLH